MVVCMTKYSLGPDTKWEAERIADVLRTELSKHSGFLDYKLAEQSDIGEYVSLVFWETREQALHAHPSIRTLVSRLVDYQFPLCIELFDVYVPKDLNE